MSKQKLNYGTLVDPEKYYPVTYSITQDGKKIFKKGKLKGCDLTEKQAHELLANPKAKIIISHGGKRKGAGRPAKEPTRTIRVPSAMVEAINKLIGK